jgi:hypothetical protein
MSRHGYSHGSDFGDAAAGGLIAMAIVIAVILAYLMFRMCCYIVQTFIMYGKTVPALRYSLVVFLTISIVGCLLAFIFQRQEFLSLFSAAFLQIFLTCVVVQRKNANTFLEDVSIQEQIIQRKWWHDDSPMLAE